MCVLYCAPLARWRGSGFARVRMYVLAGMLRFLYVDGVAAVGGWVYFGQGGEAHRGNKPVPGRKTAFFLPTPQALFFFFF